MDLHGKRTINTIGKGTKENIKVVVSHLGV